MCIFRLVETHFRFWRFFMPFGGNWGIHLFMPNMAWQYSFFWTFDTYDVFFIYGHYSSNHGKSVKNPFET
jgi:hypothetical protein